MSTTPDHTELAGHIEAVGRAVLRLSAELEMQGLIDGPRLSESWREAVPDRMTAESEVLRCARHYLHDMAQQIDEARRSRRERWLPD